MLHNKKVLYICLQIITGNQSLKRQGTMTRTVPVWRLSVGITASVALSVHGPPTSRATLLGEKIPTRQRVLRHATAHALRHAARHAHRGRHVGDRRHARAHGVVRGVEALHRGPAIDR